MTGFILAERAESHKGRVAARFSSANPDTLKMCPPSVTRQPRGTRVEYAHPSHLPENLMAIATATAQPARMFIDGKWCDALDGKTIGVINPATEEIVAPMAFGNRADCRRAIEAAA